MPTRSPHNSRFRNLLHHKPRLLKRSARGAQAATTFDGLSLWALSAGIAAGALAAFVFFGADDSTGAAFILFGTAILIAIALYASGTPRDNRSSKPD